VQGWVLDWDSCNPLFWASRSGCRAVLGRWRWRILTLMPVAWANEGDGAPSLAHHATLTGRCFKPTVSWSSPCVSGRMRSDFFKAAERLANMPDLRLTLSAPDHTPKGRLSRDSRGETTHTKDTISPPEPDAPAPGVKPPNERQAESPPEPKNLNLTDDHLLRPVLASANTGEPPYQHLHPSLTHVQQDDLSFQPIFPQQDHPSFNQETRAGDLSPLLPPAANEHPSNNTFDAFFGAHFGPWPEHIGWLQGCPLSKPVPPIDDASGHSSNRQSHLHTRILPLLLYFEQKLDHQRRGWGLPRPLRKVGHLT
jgi:hypothetical protein